jgi:hypothetical protein
LGAAVLPKTELREAGSAYRPLISGGVAVQIAYEVIWSPSSPPASEIESVISSLSATVA